MMEEERSKQLEHSKSMLTFCFCACCICLIVGHPGLAQTHSSTKPCMEVAITKMLRKWTTANVQILRVMCKKPIQQYISHAKYSTDASRDQNEPITSLDPQRYVKRALKVVGLGILGYVMFQNARERKQPPLYAAINAGLTCCVFYPALHIVVPLVIVAAVWKRVGEPADSTQTTQTTVTSRTTDGSVVEQSHDTSMVIDEQEMMTDWYGGDVIVDTAESNDPWAISLPEETLL